jgi:hypothetical protein
MLVSDFNTSIKFNKSLDEVARIVKRLRDIVPSGSGEETTKEFKESLRLMIQEGLIFSISLLIGKLKCDSQVTLLVSISLSMPTISLVYLYTSSLISMTF